MQWIRTIEAEREYAARLRSEIDGLEIEIARLGSPSQQAERRRLQQQMYKRQAALNRSLGVITEFYRMKRERAKQQIEAQRKWFLSVMRRM